MLRGLVLEGRRFASRLSDRRLGVRTGGFGAGRPFRRRIPGPGGGQRHDRRAAPPRRSGSSCDDACRRPGPACPLISLLISVADRGSATVSEHRHLADEARNGGISLTDLVLWDQGKNSLLRSIQPMPSLAARRVDGDEPVRVAAWAGDPLECALRLEDPRVQAGVLAHVREDLHEVDARRGASEPPMNDVCAGDSSSC